MNAIIKGLICCRAFQTFAAILMVVASANATAAGYFTQAGKIYDPGGQEIQVRGDSYQLLTTAGDHSSGRYDRRHRNFQSGPRRLHGNLVHGAVADLGAGNDIKEWQRVGPFSRARTISIVAAQRQTPGKTCQGCPYGSSAFPACVDA